MSPVKFTSVKMTHGIQTPVEMLISTRVNGTHGNNISVVRSTNTGGIPYRVCTYNISTPAVVHRMHICGNFGVDGTTPRKRPFDRGELYICILNPPIG